MRPLVASRGSMFWLRNRHREVGMNETVVFTEKVFDELKLRNKHVRRKVELNVPTSILLNTRN